jgi:hypothetical protein
MIGFVPWKSSSTLHNVMTGRKCCLLLDNSREKLRFRESFRAYHIPEGMIELKAEEFRNLTQGSLSIAEYHDRFA